jgi:hypothetical protein
MIFRVLNRFLILLMIMGGVPIVGVCASPNDAQEKMQAYELAVQTRYQLGRALAQTDDTYKEAQKKVTTFQDQVDSGISSAATMLDLYQKKLSHLKNSRDEAKKKLSSIQDIIDQLKKDPDVGAQVTSSEALADMSSKLQEASSILPKTP